MRRGHARLLPCVAAATVIAAALLAACDSAAPASPSGGSTAPSTAPAVVPTTPSATRAETPSATPGATPAPPATPGTPSATPIAIAPSVETFWDAVLQGLSTTGHLRINVIGPSAGVLRYEPAASATVADGNVVFVCVSGAAFDGQGGSFVPVPGSWECGGGALVGGFRNTGQPVDAWGESLPTDASIREATALEPDGRWRWDYSADSPVFGGQVMTSVWVDPATGRILDARRSDPTGSTRYGISYEEAFPPISRP